MSASHYDIVLEQGTDYNLPLVFKDSKGRLYDLTGVTGVGQIRQNIADNAALADFVITFDTNRSTGKVTLSIPASVTENLNFVVGCYDIKFTYPPGIPKRIMEGKVTFNKAVTR